MKIFAISILILLSACIPIKKEESVIEIGLPFYWGELIPSLQNTAFAAAILVNQFETLVNTGEDSDFEPNAAIDWTIDPNYKVFTFRINTKKRFSNGKPLTAQDFKSSWEHALELNPTSSNNSLQDVLYRVEGFENYKKTKTISGLIVNGDTFTIKFKQPFRTALTYLTGGRLAAFIKEGNAYLGTGPYVLLDKSDNHATFVKNKYSEAKQTYDKAIYKVIPSENAQSALEKNEIQLFMYAEKVEIEGCRDGKNNITCLMGQPARHMTLIVNGLKNKLFQNKNHRRAFLYLVFKNLNQNNLPSHLKENLAFDPQIYLPLQKGRLEKSKALEVIDSGAQYVNDFLLASQKTPVIIKTSKTEKWVKDFVKSLGVTVSEDSKIEDGKTILELYYKKYNTDIMTFGLGVSNGDPDGIYHALGKDGSITSPMTVRPRITELLEQNRNILDSAKLDEAYKKVSIAALEEVPFIHLGYLKSKIIYRSDKMNVNANYRERDDDRITSFEPHTSFWEKFK